MSEEFIDLRPAVITATAQQAFDGIDISVTLYGLEAFRYYKLIVHVVSQEGGDTPDQPTMIVVDGVEQPDGLPYVIMNTTRVTSSNPITFNYKLRLQNDSIYLIGYELQKGTSSTNLSTILNEEQNNFIITFPTVPPFLTPTPTTTEISQIRVWNQDIMLEYGEFLYEPGGIVDPFEEPDFPVNFQDGRAYIRRPGEDLIKVLEIVDGIGKVVDYRIVPSQTPTPTYTITNTGTPQPTQIDTYQNEPFKFIIDEENSLFTLSINPEWFIVPSNSSGDVFILDFTFDNIVFRNASSIVTVPDITTGNTLQPSIPGGTGNNFAIGDIASLFNLSDFEKLKITVPYDPTQTDINNIEILEFEVKDTNNNVVFSLRDALFKEVEATGDLMVLFSMFNYQEFATPSQNEIAGFQLDMNESVTFDSGAFVSVSPDTINQFTLKGVSISNRNINFAINSSGIPLLFDKYGVLKFVTSISEAETDIPNIEAIAISLINVDSTEFTKE